MDKFPKAFFVSGTDTGIGKTLVSAVLCAGLDAHYWKPVQSGGKRLGLPLPASFEGLSKSEKEDLCDSDFLRLLGIPDSRILPERYLLSRPLSPHLSARLDGTNIKLSDFELPDTGSMKHLIVEGAGGLLVPLNEKELLIDLIEKFALPVLLVAKSGLGTINHSLLSISALRTRNIEILGLIMNGSKNAENKKAIEHYGKVKVLAEFETLPQLTAGALSAAFEGAFDPLCARLQEN